MVTGTLELEDLRFYAIRYRARTSYECSIQVAVVILFVREDDPSSVRVMCCRCSAPAVAVGWIVKPRGVL